MASVSLYGSIPFTPVGAHQTNNDLSVVVALTAPPGANYLVIQAIGGAIRYRFDAADPDADTGLRLSDDATLALAVTPGKPVMRIIQGEVGATAAYQWGVEG
jgi:hypothetical protein